MFRIQPACHDSDRSPAPMPRIRSSCRCTSASSATGIRSPNPGRRPGRRATGGRCSPTLPTCSSTRRRGFALYASPERKISARPARAGSDPRRLAGRQPVRVLAALQVLPRPRLLGGEDRGAQGLEHLRPVLSARTHAARVHRRAGAGLRPRRRRGVRRAARAPERRGDPRVHVHHDDVHDARGHLRGAAPRVRRPRRPHRRDRRARRLRRQPRPRDRVRRRRARAEGREHDGRRGRRRARVRRRCAPRSSRTATRRGSGWSSSASPRSSGCRARRCAKRCACSKPKGSSSASATAAQWSARSRRRKSSTSMGCASASSPMPSRSRRSARPKPSWASSSPPRTRSARCAGRSTSTPSRRCATAPRCQPALPRRRPRRGARHHRAGGDARAHRRHPARVPGVPHVRCRGDRTIRHLPPPHRRADVPPRREPGRGADGRAHRARARRGPRRDGVPRGGGTGE